MLSKPVLIIFDPHFDYNFVVRAIFIVIVHNETVAIVATLKTQHGRDIHFMILDIYQSIELELYPSMVTGPGQQFGI